jgi:hypothetical protein
MYQLGMLIDQMETYTPPARNHRLAGHCYTEGTPAKKRVAVLNRMNLQPVTGTMSDPATGEWVIKGLPDFGAASLLVIAQDDTDTYNAEVADYITQTDGDY